MHNRFVDLHVHSNKSDGSLSPSQLVTYALEKGLAGFALTDHDTVDGIPMALETAQQYKEQGREIEVIPGIELSTEYEGRDIHILGLYIHETVPAFREYLQDFVRSRELRNEKMCQLLRTQAGIHITYEGLLARFPGAVITRAHYAQYMLEHGYVSSHAQAFSQYIGDHCKYFVPREKVTPIQAVELILAAGGIPILAHPILYRMSKQKLYSLTRQLKAVGLIGIEAIYSTYDKREELQIRRLAKELDLCISGGSDFHGKVKPGLEIGTGYGNLRVPFEVLDKLRNHLPEV